MLARRTPGRCTELWQQYLAYNIPALVIFLLIALSERRRDRSCLGTGTGCTLLPAGQRGNGSRVARATDPGGHPNLPIPINFLADRRRCAASPGSLAKAKDPASRGSRCKAHGAGCSRFVYACIFGGFASVALHDVGEWCRACNCGRRCRRCRSPRPMRCPARLLTVTHRNRAWGHDSMLTSMGEMFLLGALFYPIAICHKYALGDAEQATLSFALRRALACPSRFWGVQNGEPAPGRPAGHHLLHPLHVGVHEHGRLRAQGCVFAGAPRCLLPWQG